MGAVAAPPASLHFDNPPVLASLNEVALDEVLDALDPLRHLRSDTNDFAEQDDKDTTVVPVQPRSTLGEMIQLSFPTESPLVSISLKVDASPGCGGIAWPAGEVCDFVRILEQPPHAMQVLSNYITFRGIEYLNKKKIVELGSGTGLVGLVAGALGGTVWITDQAFVTVCPRAYFGCLNEAFSSPLLNIMHQNVVLNDLQSRVSVCELNW